MFDDAQIGILEIEKPYDADLVARFIEQGGIDDVRLIVLRDFARDEDCRKLETRFNDIIRANGSNRGRSATPCSSSGARMTSLTWLPPTT